MACVFKKRLKGGGVRPVNIRTLTENVVKEYAPEGVKSADFTEALDVDQ